MFFEDWYFKRNPGDGNKYDVINDFVQKNSIKMIDDVDYDKKINKDFRFPHINKKDIFMSFEIECDHYHHFQSFFYSCIYTIKNDIFVYLEYKDDKTNQYQNRTYEINGSMIIELYKFIDDFVNKYNQ